MYCHPFLFYSTELYQKTLLTQKFSGSSNTTWELIFFFYIICLFCWYYKMKGVVLDCLYYTSHSLCHDGWCNLFKWLQNIHNKMKMQEKPVLSDELTTWSNEFLSVYRWLKYIHVDNMNIIIIPMWLTKFNVYSSRVIGGKHFGYYFEYYWR